MADKTKFEELNDINVNDKTEKKGGLTYLSWAWSWAEVKKRCPDATYKIRCNENGLPYFKEDGVGYMCMTEVTIGGETLMMWLPVMDYKNKAILQPNMFDINKTIMRCLTKNLAMFGLGLYIYAGEDLPEVKGSSKYDDEVPYEEKLETIKGCLEIINKTDKNYWNELKSMFSIEKISDLDEANADEVFALTRQKIREIQKKEK